MDDNLYKTIRRIRDEFNAYQKLLRIVQEIEPILPFIGEQDKLILNNLLQASPDTAKKKVRILKAELLNKIRELTK